MKKRKAPVTTFSLGHIIPTPNVLNSITPQDQLAALQRYLAQDWGEVDAENRKANDRAVVDGSRIRSIYRAANGKTFWLLTVAGHAVTLVLMPEDY